ncbi:MAG: nucleoside 2-deoxyribosyltransferase [Candidatus Marinimicrobia bacterium]|nr:nucleoside 2-deoxyribosyltransferase [Candidatus Neomarinimicrobiota bacterium]MBL7066833.1 nucleoside 2-deoxyribosyltransferase [Candidatus Neomarinimicrobiota bacterium]
MNPNIEQFKLTLKRGKAGYVPIAELGIHPIMKERLLGRPVKSLKDDVDFWYKAGYDYIKLQPIADFNPGKLFLQDNENSTLDDDGTVSRNWATEGKGIITGLDDFENYIFPKKEDFDYSNFEKVRELLPEGMGVIGQYGDIFTMVWDLMGFEQFSYAIFDNPELLDALFDKIGNLVLSMFEYFAESDAVDVIWYSDDIAYVTGLMISPAVLRTYFFPWLKKIGDMAKSANKSLIYHTDGLLFDVMDDIIDCGVDALHPIEPQAMTIAEVKQRYGDRLCLIGHVDVDLLARGSTEQVREQVRKNIKEAAYNGGYCVGSGNSIPDYVKYENYIAMLEAAKEFGR